MSKVTLPISSICFIDANIIFYIEKLKDKGEFINIIEQVYERVYIHEEVYKELNPFRGPVGFMRIYNGKQRNIPKQRFCSVLFYNKLNHYDK